MVSKLSIFFIVFLFSIFSNAQNKYYINGLIATEFYNADFNELNNFIESRELLGTYLGLTISKKESNSYATLGYKFIRNISNEINLNGGSLYVSINYDILKKDKHMLYPKISLMLANYSFESDENLPNISAEESFRSNTSFSLGIGVGYEYLFKINFLKRAFNFSAGLNVEKSFMLNDLKWTLENSNIDFLDFDLLSGVSTMAVIRMKL